MCSDDEPGETADLFAEPQDYYQAERPPTCATHRTRHGQDIKLRLVGSSPLWGHLLWQAGKVISTYLEQHASILIHGKNVLELGAGAGLPSIICALRGAEQVVVTDYPDADLIANLEHNITANVGLLPDPDRPNIVAQGYLWGAESSSLTALLSSTSSRFDTLILADILFNHSQHHALLKTVVDTLAHSPDARALVFFTPYRPWLYDKDMAFFDLAREGGLAVEKVLEEVMEEVMFPDDPGDEKLRKTVFGYALSWKDVDARERLA